MHREKHTSFIILPHFEKAKSCGNMVSKRKHRKQTTHRIWRIWRFSETVMNYQINCQILNGKMLLTFFHQKKVVRVAALNLRQGNRWVPHLARREGGVSQKSSPEFTSLQWCEPPKMALPQPPVKSRVVPFRNDLHSWISISMLSLLEGRLLLLLL